MSLNMLEITKAMNSATRAAAKLVGARNTVVKLDGSPVTAVDLAASDIYKRALAPFGVPILDEEQDIPENLGDTFFTVDPKDGTVAFARGQNTSVSAVTLYENGQPVSSFAAGLGFPAIYREKAGFTGFGNPETTSGFVLQGEVSEEGRMNVITPLICHDKYEWGYRIVPPLEGGPLPERPLLLADPCLKLMSSYFNEGLAVVTSESTISSQVQVILGMADACLIGPERSLREGEQLPGPKLWDLLPTAVENAGLGYFCVSGEFYGDRFLPQDILKKVCTPSYQLKEQFLICHPRHKKYLRTVLSNLRAPARN